MRLNESTNPDLTSVQLNLTATFLVGFSPNLVSTKRFYACCFVYFAPPLASPSIGLSPWLARQNVHTHG